MKLNLLIAGAIITLILGATYLLDDQTRPAIQQVPVENQQAFPSHPKVPNVVLPLLEKETRQLHDFKGKIIVLNFWASWCVPCVVEFPQLLELAELESDNMVFIAVSVDQQKQNIDQFFKRLDKKSQSRRNMNNVYIVHDPRKEISQDVFQTIKYPETLLIAPDLTMREKIIGASVNFASDAFRKRLKEMTARTEDQ